LRFLAAAAQQNDKTVASFLKVDPVAWTIVDTKLAYTLPDRFCIAGIAEGKTIETRCNDGARPLVFQVKPPPSKFLCLFQFLHGSFVVYKLPQMRPTTRGFTQADRLLPHRRFQSKLAHGDLQIGPGMLFLIGVAKQECWMVGDNQLGSPQWMDRAAPG